MGLVSRSARFDLRSLAFVAIASLVVSGCTSSTSRKTPGSSSASASASASSVAFKDCGAQCTGVLNGAQYAIKLPTRWNGTLLLFSHGYRFATPAPPDNDPVRTTAQLTTTDSDGSGSDQLSRALLAKGYALAGSGYRSNGWAVADGVAAGEQLHEQFEKVVGKPQRVYVWGDSLGGLITEILNEKHPDWVSGAAPMCGAVAGPNLNFNLALDVAFAVKTLIDPGLKLTGYTSSADAGANFSAAATAVKTAAADIGGGGTAKVLLIAALVDAPSQTRTYDGSDLISQVKARVEAILTALGFGTLGRYEIEQRIKGNPSSNVGTDYAQRISTAERGLIATAGGNADTLLAQLKAAPRVAAAAAATTAFEQLGDTTGNVTRPTITMHTEADPLVVVQNETILAARTAAKKRSTNLAQLYIKAPASYPESSGAPYGAGHCVFTTGQRSALIDTLDAWVRSGTAPVPSALVGRFTAGLDPTYTPGAWPAAT